MSIKSNVSIALTSVAAYAKAVQGLRNELQGRDATQVRATLLPHVAAFYSVAVIDGAGKATGTKVLDKDATKYEAAKKALQRLGADILGKSANKAEEVAIPASVQRLAKLLALECAKYEGARSLASKAVAEAFAK